MFTRDDRTIFTTNRRPVFTIVPGGVTGVVGASGGATASIANIGINGLSSSAEYGLTQLNNGNPVTTFGATISFLTGAAISSFSEAIYPGNSSLGFANEMMARTNNPWTFNSYKVIAKKLARGALTVGGVTQTARTFTENGWNNIMNKYLQSK